MHALLITFTTDAPLEELVQPMTEYAHGLCSIDGLVSKTWIAEGTMLGGFHVFTSRAAADAYMATDMAAGLVANPAFHDFEFRHFDILDELSAITGTSHIPLAA
ncbi:MAG: YdhR family protein [Actinomycetota bacterium]